mmetsp:Transcript_118625/g.221697  ORF Transcript_118625/g.221697 Transcript_118625/m.221697 type:complete len:252 (+) Transcript_118625:27-782(+)
MLLAAMSRGAPASRSHHWLLAPASQSRWCTWKNAVLTLCIACGLASMATAQHPQKCEDAVNCQNPVWKASMDTVDEISVLQTVMQVARNQGPRLPAKAANLSLEQAQHPVQRLPHASANTSDPKGGHRPFFAQLATYLHRVKRTRTGRTQGLIDDWTSLFPSLPSITVSLFIAVVFVLPVICYCCIRVVEESEPDRKAFFPDDPRRHPQPILRLDFNTGSGWNGCIGLSLVSFLILGITYAWSTGMGGMML